MLFSDALSLLPIFSQEPLNFILRKSGQSQLSFRFWEPSAPAAILSTTSFSKWPCMGGPI